MTTLSINMTLSTQLEQTPDAPTAPGLAVSGNVITVTLTSDPESYGEAITGRGVRYSTDGVNWTNAFLFTSGEAIARSGETPLLYETLYFVQWRAANANGAGAWSPSASITTEAEPAYVAPSLSSETASANGARSFSGSVTTNKAGTLYVYASTNASETQATILASGTPQNVAAAGSVPFSGIGVLTPETTYYVHLAFTDGTNTDTATTASFTTAAQGVGTGTVTVTLARATSPAVNPYAVMYDVAVSGGTVAQAASNAWDPAFSHYTVITDWDDPTAPSDKVVNVPTQWNDLNTSYGFQPSHVYNTPGTYNPVFRVYEPDGTFVGEDTVTIVVANADTTFSGTRTILVDPANVGDATNYPSANVVTTWAAALSASQALNQTCQILLKRGSTTQITSTQQPGSSIDNLYVGAWGPGSTRPIIELPATNSITAGSATNVPGSLFNWENHGYSIVFDGIDFIGPWDAATETGGQYRLIRLTKEPNNRRLLLNNCTSSGFAATVNDIPFGSGDAGYWINNCDITNWGDYGLILYGTGPEAISILGTAIHQKDDAYMGGGDKHFDINQHGPIRIQAGGRTNIEVVDLFTRNGWFVNADSPDPPQPTAQPCTRFFFGTSASPSFYPRCNVSRYAAEGGQAIVQIKNQNRGGSGGAINFCMDKTLLVATACTWEIFEVQWSGWTVKNCLIFIPNVQTRNQPWYGIFNDYELNVSKADNPVEIFNLTAVNLKNATSLDGAAANFDNDINGTKLATSYTQENNAVYQVSGSPTEAIDVDLSTAMPTVGGVWTSRYLGMRWRANGANVSAKLTMDTSNASPAGFVTTAVPGASSPLVNDATTGLTAYDDFYGTVRSSPDRGAVERT
jgi:hypothetical protein